MLTPKFADFGKNGDFYDNGKKVFLRRFICVFMEQPLFVTGFISANRTCFSFHKHSNINFSRIGLSCLALRIGKSWFALCNVIV